MPELIVAVAASAAGSAVAGAIGLTAASGFAFYAVSAAASFVVASVLGKAMGGDGESTDFGSVQSGRLHTVRSAIQPRRIIYGEVLVAGTLLAPPATSNRDGSAPPAAVTLTLATAATLGETRIMLAGWDQKNPHGLASGQTFTLGGTTYTIASAPQYFTPSPEEGFGVSGLVVETTAALVADYSAGAATSLTYQPPATTLGGNNDYLYLVLALAGHEVDSINDIYFNELPSTDARFTVDGTPYFTIEKHLGTDTQAASPMLLAAFPDYWTAAHQLCGIAYIVVRLRWNADVWPSGIPNVKALVKGKKVYDPRYPANPAAWSANWALCVRDYLSSSYGLGCTAAEIDDVTVIASANDADYDVPINGTGGTQKRYTCDGTIDLSQKPKEILEGMKPAGAGIINYAQGKWRVLSGAFRNPIGTLTESDLRGPINVAQAPSRRDLYNAVRGTYTDPQNQWQPSDFPLVANATYAAADGDAIYRDISLPFTKDGIRAQRIAKIGLEKSRQGITVKFPAKLAGLKFLVGDTLYLKISLLGWDALNGGLGKIFVVTQWDLTPDGGVDLMLQEEASGVYDWNYGNATIVDYAPNTALTSPFLVYPPTALTLTETVYHDAGGYRSRVQARWTASPDGRLREYIVQVSPAAANLWSSFTTTATVYDFPDAPQGSYDVRVKAMNIVDSSSSWLTGTVAVHGPAGVISALGLPSPIAPKISTEIDANGDVVKVSLTTGYAPGTGALPDGVAVFYAITDHLNALDISAGGTGASLTIAGSEVIGTGTVTALAGSTASALVVTTAQNPLPDNRNIYGMVWMQFGSSQWRKAVSSDATTVYFDEPFDVAPTPGVTVNWVEAAWVDMRAAEFRLGYLTDGTNYEIIQWGRVEQSGGVFSLAGCQRGEEETAPISADGRKFYYFPAPGAGTETLLFPLSAFRETAPGQFTATIDATIKFKKGQYASASCCTYVALEDKRFERSPLVPLIEWNAL
jgi:hypothetical protein